MSLYYEKGESTKIGKAYSENKQVWLVYKGDNLVWSFKEDYASMKLSDYTYSDGSYYSSWYFTNGHSIRFYDMRNVGLTPEIKSYKDVTNHKKHCKNVYANTYNLLSDGSYKETGIYSCTGNFVFDYEDVDENLFPACGVLPFGPTLNIDTNSINYTYYVKNDNSPDGVDRIDTIRDYSFFNGLFKNCINMHGSFERQSRLNGKAVCGALTKDFSSCFKNCSNISEAVCGPSVVNMASSYESCSNLTGSAACGHSVINMAYSYKRCYNLTQAACGSSVVNMAYAYERCGNLTGSAACGLSVVNMECAYYACSNLTKASCSDSVVNMRSTYDRCYNLTGYAVCGSSVEDMHATYWGCRNLQYGVCGENVKDFSSAYEGCSNLLSCDIGNNVTNMYNSFSECGNLISIYCDNDLVENMRGCFYECHNLQTFYMSNSAVDIRYCYFGCSNIIDDVRIPKETLYASGAFRGCSNISRASIESSKINDMSQIFQDCKNLKRVTIIGSTENIVKMGRTFAGCTNLTSLSISASSLSNITDMDDCFRGCTNLRMQCIIPPKVVNIRGAYYGCENVYGSVTLPNTITSMSFAFSGTGVTYVTFPSIGSNQRISMGGFMDRSKNIINKYGTVTLYCPAGSGALNSIKETYNFYKNDNGTIVYTGHNNAYDIDLRII